MQTEHNENDPLKTKKRGTNVHADANVRLGR